MGKIQRSQYYNSVLSDSEYKEYVREQIVRSGLKSYKKRARSEYEVCFEHFVDFIKDSSKMICLGTRNNHERDVFSELSKDTGLKVFSQDIAKKSGADFVGDFSVLSEFVTGDWDIIYSNSLDHAIDANNAFYEWLSVMKSEGIMVLGFDFCYDDVGKVDCNGFEKSMVDDFMNDGKGFKLIESFNAIDYYYYMVKKI